MLYEPADSRFIDFSNLLLLWPFSLSVRDLFPPSLVTTALRIPHQWTAFIGMAVLHNLCYSANVSPALKVWDTSAVTAFAWMWNPDLLCGGFMGGWCVLTSRFSFVRFLLVFLVSADVGVQQDKLQIDLQLSPPNPLLSCSWLVVIVSAR